MLKFKTQNKSKTQISKPMFCYLSFVLCHYFVICALSFGFWVFAPVINAFSQTTNNSEIIGEAFGRPVTKEEFFYYYKTASIFTRAENKEANKPRSEEETRQEAWQNLIFTQEAKAIGIAIDREELKEELKRLISQKDNNIEYASENYNKWVAVNFYEEPKIFESRIENLLRINKLMKEKMDPTISVTEEEMQEKFLNQYNSFESEYIKFDSEKEAKDFTQAVKKEPKLWKETFDRKKAEAGQKGAAWINIMSLEALIDLWKIPKEDAYRILEAGEGDFITAKNYYGDAVFRLLFKRKADLKEYDEKKQDYYRKMLISSKKYKIAKDYFEDLLRRANYRDYVKEKEDALKKEKLKEKSLIMLETNQGNIELRLFPDAAPKACENFIGLVGKGFYNGIIFHRVIKDFMLQGGDPTGTGAGGESIWGGEFQDELSDNLVFDRAGLLAMANSGPNTNKSQFFITLKPAPWLNKKHTIFGEVISGMDVVRKIEVAPTGENDKPKAEQKILKAYVKETNTNKE